jgi:ankyrin repeat protein
VEEGASVECVKMLLQHGANPSVYDEFPLRRSASLGRVEIARMLIQHGADYDEVLKRCFEREYYPEIQILIKARYSDALE